MDSIILLFQINHSDVDWNLTAQIEGAGFVGPPSLLVHAHTSASYQLCFQPVYEGKVEVIIKTKIFRF